MSAETDEELREILGLERIAVVGCSTTPGKAAHDVPAYLIDWGYDVVPVNPGAEEVLDRTSYESLAAVPGSVDVVNVFRPSDEVAGIVDEAIERGDVAVVWTQRGIRDDEAARRAEAAGIRAIQDRCIRTTHRRLH